MFPSKQLTTNWPAEVNGTLIRGAPYQVVRGDTPPPEVRRATPTKHQSSKGSPHQQSEPSRVRDKVRGESRPIPVMQRDPSVRPPEPSLPPVKPPHTLAPKNPQVEPAHTLAPNNPPVKHARTLASDNSPVKPVPTSAPDNLPAKPIPTLALDNPPAKPASTLAPSNPPDLPTMVLPKGPPGRCKQCTQPTPDVRDFTHIRPCLRC